MKYYSSNKELLSHIKNKSIKKFGLVPTMGSLHLGHISLIEKAIIENELVIISIFINPTQFENNLDLKKYPKNLEKDLKILNKFSKSIIIYVPEVSDIYSEGVVANKYFFGSIEDIMEGKQRKGHFQGVATIVEKLLMLFKPNNAYFGEKDFQQLQIIRNLVVQKKIKTKIIGCKIIREENGLALSSRNKLLDEHQIKLAPILYQTLKETQKLKNKLSPNEIIKYVEKKISFFPDEKSLSPINNFNINKKIRTFIAVKFGEIRLIDNLQF
jgi:pantoate--beta-alanine ligase